MIGGSLFSGIGGFDLGFRQAGIETAWQVEYNLAARSVLAKHFSEAERYTDVRDVGKHNLATVDLISGGFPCQDVSLAGRRKGLAGDRSGLWFEFARIIDEFVPAWVVIENVPGLLSSNRGRDFAVIIRWLADRGYGVAWRVLDSQYFGLAQRRKRVFIVGSFGNGRSAQVLFDPESGSWNTPPQRQTGQVSPTLLASGAGTGRTASAGSEADFCVPFRVSNMNGNGKFWGEDTTPTMDTGDPMAVAIGARNLREQPDGISGTLQSKSTGGYSLNYINPVLAIAGRGRDGEVSDEYQEDQAYALTRSNASKARIASQALGVRRLTPTECERLQGFPDGWTAGQSDSTRYKQLGNAVSVPVAAWIGRRIIEVNRGS